MSTACVEGGRVAGFGRSAELGIETVNLAADTKLVQTKITRPATDSIMTRLNQFTVVDMEFWWMRSCQDSTSIYYGKPACSVGPHMVAKAPH